MFKIWNMDCVLSFLFVITKQKFNTLMKKALFWVKCTASKISCY